MFRYKGYTYDIIIRPWLKGNKIYECIKWKTGYRNFWNRISYDEYKLIKSKYKNK